MDTSDVRRLTHVFIAVLFFSLFSRNHIANAILQTLKLWLNRKILLLSTSVVDRMQIWWEPRIIRLL